MSIQNRFLSVIMAFCMLFGTLAALSDLTVFAADVQEANEQKEPIDYLNHVFESKEAKLATMTAKPAIHGYQLYYDATSGEVAVLNTVTGDVLFSNPYDVGGTASSENIKNQILSQIIIQYSNNEGEKISMYSYVEAALREQIKVKNIKNGIRVEYVMGQQEARSLVPMQIEKSRFEEMILANITSESDLNFAKYMFVEYNPEGKTQAEVKKMNRQFPITKTYAIYVYNSMATERDKNKMENIIKKYCPEYTYEELDYDYKLVEYENEDKNPPQFRLALEYTLDEQGLSVRLPANGIRFDQSLYLLEYIRILPFMGAGSSEFTGYTMIPDGSGTLVRFEDALKTKSNRLLSGALYGQDYAYHEIGGANQQIMRMPIFGLVEDTVYSVQVPVDEVSLVGNEFYAEGDDTTEAVGTTAGNTAIGETTATGTTAGDTAIGDTTATGTTAGDTAIGDTTATGTTAGDTTVGDTTAGDTASDDTTAEEETPSEPTYRTETYRKKFGYLAIIEEGDALASITTEHSCNVYHKYATVYTQFNPRPKDSYNLASTISVAGNNVWTVVSDRKYTGSYRIRYIMLTDYEYAAKNAVNVNGFFDTSYVGMALAYRDHLIRNGILTNKVEKADQIPLYLETLGVIDVQDKFLSIPITVKKALTSFEDIKTITEELGEAGVNNLVCKLTGFINGGMISTVANRIDVEKEAGNDAGLADLIEFAKEKGIELFLDVDFSYVEKDGMFDGFSKKTQAIRTIDGRYTQKRTYSPTLQYFTSTGLVAISPSVFSDIFEDMESDLEDLGLTNISVGTVGSDLSTDFDEKDPYNREDSKQNVIETLSKIREAGYAMMMDGGNAYAVGYAKHVLNVPLDSSNYTYASEAIPLFGLVYHGYLSYAGTPTNTAGDVRYEMLKIMENGANPYFIVAYRNTEKLKEDPKLSGYFSISYENWKEDMVDTYHKLNDVLNFVMDSPIKNHGFLIGERVPTEAEKAADAEADRLAQEEADRLAEESRLEAERQENLKDHLEGKKPAPETSETETDEAPETTAPTVEPEAPEAVAEGDDEEEEEEEGYPYTKYTSDDGRIVKVTFENGYSFILNYNIFDVTVVETGDVVIPALGYLVLNEKGEIVVHSAEEVAA